MDLYVWTCCRKWNYCCWATHIQEFAASVEPLKEIFPQGGFALHGNSKVFGLPAAALAMYTCLKSSKKKIVAGLLIPAALTGFLTGITEPIEFTFLFAGLFYLWSIWYWELVR